ncbi:MAG: glycosyltransferase family 4 protein, partial [Chitinophagaceae bacterium]
MKIAYIASFPPRECGIATFTRNLTLSIGANLHAENCRDTAIVIAVNEGEKEYDYPPEVRSIIRQDQLKDYTKAAEFITHSEAQACILQHEFGIYGGESGIYILSLLHKLKMPVIVTLHTVLKEPTYLQKAILCGIATQAKAVVVMSHKAVTFLENIYNIPADKIHLIEHGVPDISSEKISLPAGLPESFRNRRLLLTFGLLNRNKGIETVIRALPEIVMRHPDVIYLVLGNTHPGVIRASGEEYRAFLYQLAADMGMKDHVYFINKFVDEKELVSYLSYVDIYITPYLNEAQITSGTLSYAIGVGAASISTPYWHAQELLAEGRGLLFNFKNSSQLAEKVNGLLDNPDQLEGLREKAWEYGQKLRWPRIGKQYLKLIQQLTSDDLLAAIGETVTDVPEDEISPFDTVPLPAFNLAHIIRLTDDTGILQHARYGIPNLKEGYCVDDNARAIILMIMASRYLKNHDALKLLPVYLSFMNYMQLDEGLFRNFLDFKREYKDDVGSEDAFGRAIWALGFLIHYAPHSSFREFGIEAFSRSESHFLNLHHLRGIANTIIGIAHYLFYFPADENILHHLCILTGKLTDAYRSHASKDWHWFEEKLIYDNSILPLAMLHSYE